MVDVKKEILDRIQNYSKIRRETNDESEKIRMEELIRVANVQLDDLTEKEI